LQQDAGWNRIKHRLQLMFQSLGKKNNSPVSSISRERSASEREADDRRIQVMLRGVKDYALFIVDSKGNIATWNEGAESLYCYKEHEILGRSLATLFLDRTEGEQQFEIGKSLGRAESEGWRVRSDGSRFWAVCILTAVMNSDGTMHGFVNITRDRSERHKADEALRHMHAQMEAQADRIAHALHDESGQLLVMVRIALDELASGLPVGSAPKVKKIVDQLDLIESRLRDFSHELSPTVVDNLGFEGALQSLTESYSRRTHIAIDCDCKGLDGLPSHVKVALYRITQEALTNIWRHAKATRVTVNFSNDSHAVKGLIRDNGAGFDVGKVRAIANGGLGLAGIEARIRLLAGSFAIESEPGRGSQLLLTVPLAKKHVYQDLAS
jgi:PAS domain S-box-containing protein